MSPAEEAPGAVHRITGQMEPGLAELALLAEHRRAPMGGGSNTEQDVRDDNENLADEGLGRHMAGLGWERSWPVIRPCQFPTPERAELASPRRLSPTLADSNRLDFGVDRCGRLPAVQMHTPESLAPVRPILGRSITAFLPVNFPQGPDGPGILRAISRTADRRHPPLRLIFVRQSSPIVRPAAIR